ncbi:MAG: flagellar protein FlgN [Desulfovibrio sp.]|jgi:flagellar biosynthesis/type III secretory pathway chaperone|nr:flagellar protein FlgN [Desulfovibrio sp.]
MVMFAHIHGNLHRQFKALELLLSLLEEEFGLLRARDTEAVTCLEFSIHELLRQILRERMDLKKILQETTLGEYAGLLPEEEGAAVNRLYARIDDLEQQTSRLASRNAELSLALLDQSQSLLSFLHSQIAPRRRNTYNAKGRFCEDRPAAALISGRL